MVVEERRKRANSHHPLKQEFRRQCFGLSVFFRVIPGPWTPKLLLGISKNTEADSIGLMYDLDETLVGCPTSIILLCDDIRLPFLQSMTFSPNSWTL
jgi:hypothetical protein